MSVWPFDRQSVRRREIRRSKVEREGSAFHRWIAWIDPTRSALTILVTLTAWLILNIGGQRFDLKVGQSLSRAVAARVDFQSVDHERTREMRLQARDTSPNFYKLDTGLLESLRGRLSSALAIARAHGDDPARLVAAAGEARLVLDEPGLIQLSKMAARDDGGDFQRQVDAALKTLRTLPIVDPADFERRRASEAILVDSESGAERTLAMTQLAFTSDSDSVSRKLDDVVRSFPETLRASMRASMLANIAPTGTSDSPSPVYRFDSEQTASAARLAEQAVAPQNRTYLANQVLVGMGEVTPDEHAILAAEHAAFQQSGQWPRFLSLRLDNLARGLLTFLVVLGVVMYVWNSQHGTRTHPLRRIVTAGIVLAILAAARATFLLTDAPAHIAVAFIAFAAGSLAVGYPTGVVFAVCGGLSILMALAVQQGVGFLITLLAVAGTFVLGLRDVRRRGKIVLVGGVGAIVALASSLCAALIEGQPTPFALRLAMWAGMGALLAGFVLEGALPGMERLFRFSTGMTLLEWCDPSKPLLRTMAAEAPGTYNHSLLVGSLAEAGAEAIGANGLLARAGAYYHDIGKINKPQYFIENQSPGASQHERLSPAMSLLIIVNHVKDGIEMAHEYALPPSLIPFIAEHHGTTLVEFFYHAATKKRKPEDPEVSDLAFRYPGPKPQSRETAIVMVADSVEGAVRSMTDPTPGRIEDLVAEIVRKRLTDGQFDECELTFQELAAVEKSLVKSLCGIYHARIVYPEDERSESRSTASTTAQTAS